MASEIKKILGRLFQFKVKQSGKNNIIDIPESTYLKKVKIKIYGSGNRILIKEKAYLHSVQIRLGHPDMPVNNCSIIIGEGTSFNSADIQLGESESYIHMGNNCMFSFNIEISCTDTHAIFDMDGNLINRGKSIEIGSNVWICKNSCILKNTKIPDNCIVAQNSVVTKSFKKENCILAGIPAKIVKENINWTRKRPEYIIRKEQNA